MEPFESHPAHPGGLRARAQQFGRLAEQAVDLAVVSDRSFRPATAAWDGVAAAELRDAPRPVRERAAEVAGGLGWAAAPLRYWADRVSAFNTEVDRLRERYDQVPSEVDEMLRARHGAAAPRLEPALEQVRWSEIRRRRRDLERRWHEVYGREIDQGARDVAAMLRDGPTWEHQALVRRAGALPPSGLFGFFAARWEEATAPAEAIHLAERIGDPSHRPTPEDLERFAYLLEHYATDEAFAYELLTAIGPEGLLTLYGTVALQQPDGSHRAFDGDLAGLQAAIQVGLATALATATRRRGSGGGHPYADYTPAGHELPPEWVDQLLAAGRERVTLSVPFPSGHGEVTADLYGYQLIGVMLGASEVPFDTDLLVALGADLIRFERTVGWSAHGGEGVPIWYDTWYPSNGVAGGTPVRLNWTEGVDGDANAGFDPVRGLLRALAGDVEATRELLNRRTVYEAEEHAGDTTTRTRLPMVDYLLTERAWMADVAGHYDHPDARERFYPPEWGHDWSRHNPAHALLGQVLEQAAAPEAGGPVDQRAVRIFEAVVRELNADWPAPDRDDMIPAAMRGSVARMFESYIVDINNDIGNYPMRPDHGAVLNRVDLVNLLVDLGRDARATETVRVAQHAYAYDTYRYYLSGAADPDSTLASRLLDVDQVTIGNGRVLAALDVGIVANEMLSEEERLRQLLETRQQDRAWFEIIASGAANVGMAVAPTPGVVNEGVKVLVAAAFNATPEPTLTADELNSVDALREELDRMLDEHADHLVDQVAYAAYDSGALTGLPDRLIDSDTREPLPRSVWEESQLRDDWVKYLSTTDDGRVVRDGAAQAGDEYRDSYVQYRVTFGV